jgi:hypothetical protein
MSAASPKLFALKFQLPCWLELCNIEQHFYCTCGECEEEGFDPTEPTDGCRWEDFANSERWKELSVEGKFQELPCLLITFCVLCPTEDVAHRAWTALMPFCEEEGFPNGFDHFRDTPGEWSPPLHDHTHDYLDSFDLFADEQQDWAYERITADLRERHGIVIASTGQPKNFSVEEVSPPEDTDLSKIGFAGNTITFPPRVLSDLYQELFAISDECARIHFDFQEDEEYSEDEEESPKTLEQFLLEFKQTQKE